MTESSPWTVGMIDTRKSIVRPRTRSLKRPSCGDALLGDVELRHDLDPRDDRAVVPLVDRVHRLVEDAVDPVLDEDDVLLRLDVDVRRPPLDRVEDDRVDELDDRRRVLRDPVDREGLFPLLVLADELEPEVLGGLVEDALRRLALLEDVGDRRAAPDLEPQGQTGEELELVELHDVGRVGADHRQRLLGSLLRDEGVAEHPLDTGSTGRGRGRRETSRRPRREDRAARRARWPRLLFPRRVQPDHVPVLPLFT